MLLPAIAIITVIAKKVYAITRFNTMLAAVVEGVVIMPIAVHLLLGCCQ